MHPKRVVLLAAVVALASACASTSAIDRKIAAAEAEQNAKIERLRAAVEEAQVKQARHQAPSTYVRMSDMYAMEAIVSMRPAGLPPVGRDQRSDVLLDSRRAECPACIPIRVWFGTNRAPVQKPNYFGIRYAGRLHYGSAVVTLPPGHERTVLESPPVIAGIEGPFDLEDHVTLVDVANLRREEFLARVRSKAAQGDVLLVIHGYNVSFRDAARRTAQFAYDLQLPVVPVFYSWPSAGSMIAYTRDEEHVPLGAEHLAQFLRELSDAAAGRRIHVIAHSMGNRVLGGALKTLSDRGQLNPNQFHHIVLAAADITPDQFDLVASAIRRASSSVTLYASAKDWALKASYLFHFFLERMGDARYLRVVDGIDTIDVSALEDAWFALGHSYVFSSIVKDVNALIRGVPAGPVRALEKQRDGSWKARTR